MSQNNQVTILQGHLNSFDLTSYSLSTYFFELTNLPLVNSISLSFDLQNNAIYKNCKIIYISDRDDIVTYNGITYIGFNMPECNDYCKLLIGKVLVVNGKKIKITNNNCINYKNLLLNKIIIDFSGSEQIKEILDKTDEFNQRVCQTFTVSYFTEN